MEITIERTWRHKKSTCVAIINHLTGTRGGYCSVPRSHPFFNKPYDHHSLATILVHGGLTYSGKLEWASEYIEEITPNLWWFGFDCFHSLDLPDPELMRNTALQEIKQTNIQGRTFKDFNYVKENCNDLATQLSKSLYNSIDFITSEN